MYNPYQHASELGVAVKWGNLGETVQGFYDHQQNTIWLSEALGFREARCVLAHEIVHAEFTDTGLEADKASVELRCDKIAASRLIYIPQLMKAMVEVPEARYWCAELGVMPWVLKHYLQDITPQERIDLQKHTGRVLEVQTLQERLADAGHPPAREGCRHPNTSAP